MTAETRPWFYLAVGITAAMLIYLLKPILTPFAIAAMLAYLGDPLVDWLERRRLGRTAGVVAVFAVIFSALLVLTFLLVPNLEQQFGALARQLPRYIGWVEENIVPRLANALGLEASAFGFDAVKALLLDHWRGAGGLAMGLVSDISRSGLTIAGWAANLALIPVVAFYLLRDWDKMIRNVHDLFPRTIAPTIATIGRECDAILGEFFRGQLLVMLVLALIYWFGLWIVGLELALLIGLSAGLVSFVPYLGFVVGISLALIAGFFQFDSSLPMVWVAVVFGVGQLLEGMALTPLLVGDRIGLHPVAVIFAVLAGGQLFGFFGVLLALPAAAVIVVALRHLHDRYVESEIYGPQ